MPRHARQLAADHPWLTVFTLLYLGAGLGGAVALRNWEFFAYLVQMGALIALIVWADKRARFTPGVLWGLSIWGFMHASGGIIPVPREWAEVAAPGGRAVLYGLWLIPPRILKYDNLVHCYGFFVATLAVWQALRPFLSRGARPTFAFFIILACAGMGLGAVNEMIEFAATLILPQTGVGGYFNNSMDLVFNAIGATSAAVFVRWRHRSGFGTRGAQAWPDAQRGSGP